MSTSSSSFPQQALLSVFNKTGIIEFSQTLVKCGITLISTGGTAKSLSDANIPVTSVSFIQIIFFSHNIKKKGF